MKIMVCYNGSRSSRTALEYGIRNAKILNGKIFIVASMDNRISEDAQEMIRIGKEHEEAESRISQEGIECESHVLVRGLDPGEDLVKYADDNEMDYIIVGIRKRSKMDKMIFGSTAQYIILNASCPVITIK
jgi:nucleotide-binding universal stress UspA family protein